MDKFQNDSGMIDHVTLYAMNFKDVSGELLALDKRVTKPNNIYIRLDPYAGTYTIEVYF